MSPTYPPTWQPHIDTLYVCLYLERCQPHFWYYNVAKKCVVLCPKTAVIVKFKLVLIAVRCSTFSVCRLHLHPQHALADMAAAQLTLLLVYF